MLLSGGVAGLAVDLSRRRWWVEADLHWGSRLLSDENSGREGRMVARAPRGGPPLTCKGELKEVERNMGKE